MRKKFGLPVILFVFFVGIPALNAQPQAQPAETVQIDAEMQETIDNINLSFRVVDREAKSLRAYVQYLLDTIVEKEKKIIKLEALLKKSK